MTDRLIRQWDIIPADVLTVPITVIGAGAIGSHTTKALAQMGCVNLTVFDDDEVSEENLNAQGYGYSHLSLPKVQALAMICRDYAGAEIAGRRERYERGAFEGIVISAVDNMATRKTIWEQHKGRAGVIAVIDPRMGAEDAWLLTMRPDNPQDIASYEKTLYTDEEAVQERCTAKSTIYTALLLSGLVCKAVKDLLLKEPYPRIAQWNIRANDLHLWNEKRE